MDISLLDRQAKVEVINDMRSRSGQIGEVYIRKVDVSYTVEFEDGSTEEFHSEELKEVEDDSS